ncbi:hypothetical protein BH09PAT2_BH09PAT2_01300 [soil metagenome]
MKKLILSAAIIASFISYAFIKGRSTNVATVPSLTNLANNSTTQTTTSTNALYKDGEYAGTAEDAYYGNIQVKAVIQNGQLADVVFLQYPNDHHESVEINTRAMPILKEEAIQAQNANVDIVSRATDSSQAFIKSLSAALQEAHT